MDHVLTRTGYTKPAFGTPGLPKYSCTCGLSNLVTMELKGAESGTVKGGGPHRALSDEPDIMVRGKSWNGFLSQMEGEISVQDELAYYRDRVFRRLAGRLTVDLLKGIGPRDKRAMVVQEENWGLIPTNMDYLVDEDSDSFRYWNAPPAERV